MLGLVGIGIRDRITLRRHHVQHFTLQDVVRGYRVGRREGLRIAYRQLGDRPLVLGHFVNDLHVRERHIALVRHRDGVLDHFVQTNGLAFGHVGRLDHFDVRQEGLVVDVVVIHRSGVAVHCILNDGVLDLFAAGILVKVGEGVLPAISLGHGLGRHNFVAVHHLHGNGGRTEALDVVQVVPGLLTRDADLFNLVAVGNVVAFILRLVASHSHLGDIVGDLLTLGIHGQVVEGVLPLVLGGHGLAVDPLELVLALHDQQVHGDALRTLAILVRSVVPELLAGDAGGCGSMAVGNVVTVHLGGVDVLQFLGQIFLNGVRNGLASLVDRQVLEGVLPLAFGGHGGTLHLFAVRQQVHGDLGGTLAILVVCVIPGLGHLDLGGVRRVLVGDGGAFHLGGVDVLQVLRQHFFNGVLDLLASHVSGQVFEAVLPIALGGHGGRLSNLSVVDRLHGSHQVHGDAVGTQAILVISVVPNLHAGDAGLARRVLVGDGDEASLLIGLDLGGVFRHRIFGHGVGDQLAASIGVQIGETELPVAVHVGSHIGAVNLRAVSQQVHGDADRTLAILVLSVAPDLLAAHRGLDDLVGVGDGETIDAGFVAFHLIFGDGVGDLLTRLLHRQVGEGMLPLAILIGNDRLVHLLTIGQQLHLDVGRPLAILVLVVEPGLGHLDLGGGRRVGVDQRHGGFGLGLVPDQFLAGGLVAFHSDLVDAVSDLLTLLVLVEVGEAPLPAILSGSGGVLEGLVILQQVDGDAVGTQAVLIVGILPFLGAVDSNLLDLVGVDDVVAVHVGGVAFHLILGDGVIDLLADLARLVHRQVVEAPLPAVVGGHGGRIDFHIISQQTHGDALGTLAVLVVVVLPGLGALHLGGVDVVGVGHDIAGSSVASHSHFVASRHGRFFHGILDLSTLAELVKVLEGVGPVVVGVQFNRLVGSLAISQQVDGHARGTLVVLVVGVVPDLGHLHFGLFDLVGVLDVVAVHGGGVDIHQILAQHFLNAVGNFLTISMGRQVGEAVLPLGLGVHSLGFLHLTVSQQVHGDGSRPLAVLVVRVVPGLGAGDAGHARSMGVGDGVASLRVAGDLRLVARHSQLLDGVSDLLATRVLGQIFELPVPAVLGGHFLTGHGLAGSSQRDGDLAGTQTILVILVLPNLGHADLSLLGRVGVCHGEASSNIASDGSRVAVHLILGNGVDDLLNGAVVVAVHRQIVEAELPFGGFVHNSGINHIVIGQQVDGHTLSTDAVLVVLVFPHLGAFHLGGGDVVGVGDGVALGRVAGDDRQLIAIHLILGHGVGHDLALFAFLIDRKLFEGCAPVGGSQLGGAILVAVGQQLHDDGSRPQAVAVAVVFPHLGHAHACLAGRVGVLHVVVLHLGGVVAHSVLGDGVFDFHANLVSSILRQVLPLPSPVFLFDHGLGVDDLAVSQQVDGDALRTEARHVVEVIPVLLASHGDRLDGVRVGHVVAALGDLGGVASHRLLGDGVDDLLAALAVLVELVLGQVLPLPSPAVVSGHGLGFLHGVVSPQVDGDLGRALAILVLVIFPGLGAFHGHHFGLVGVLDVVASHHGSVGLGGIIVHVFLHGVDDRLAALVVLNLELGQVGEAVLPLVLGSDSLGFLHLAVSQQLHDDAVGTQAILVVRVIPGLGAFHLDRGRSMAVGDGKAIDDGGVVGHRILADGVHDLGTTIAILGQAGEAVLPVAIRISRLSSNGRHLALQFVAVSIQTHGDAIGTQAILVVGIIPGLSHIHHSLFGLVGVGDGKAVDLGSVLIHRSLGDGILDLRAVRILGQLGEGVLPDAISAEGSFLNLSAIGQQLHLDVGGALAVLVLVVDPGLGHLDLGGGRLVGIDQRHGGFGLGLVPDQFLAGDGVAFHSDLFDGVSDLLTLLVLVEVGEAELPLAIDLGHFLGRQNIVANLQVDGDAAGTLAVLVIRIVPHLGAFDADLLDVVLVGDVEVIDGRGVAFHLDLFDGVLDLSAALASGLVDLILGQVGEAVRPVALGVGGNGSHLVRQSNAVSLQLHGDAVGTLAILVIVVDPGLGARDGSSLGSMGVGHGEASSSVAADDALVALYLNFLDGVHDRGTLIVLVQISEGGSPAVASIQHNGLARRLAISQQVDGHAAGTDAVLVAIVLPLLGHGHRGLLGNVSVGHVVAALGDLGGVVRHLFLGDGVDDGGLLVVHVLVRGQISPLPSPAIFVGHGLRSNLGAISQQVDDDLLRPHLVAVVVVIPGLAAGNRGGFRRVSVGDGNLIAVRLLGRAIARRHVHLSNGIGNKLAISTLSQVSKVVAPIVSVVQYSGFRRFPVGQQLHSNAGRTGHVTVVAIFPNLGYFQAGLAGRVGVDDVHAGDNRSVTLRHASFLHSVHDRLLHSTGFVLQHIGERVVPVTLGIGRNLGHLALNRHTVSQQLHSNLARALAILVVAVVPGLGAAHADLLRPVGVGDVVTAIGGLVAFHRIFSDGVLDLLTRCVLGQILEAVAPVGRSIHGHRILLGAISIQPHGDAVGTDAILVAGIAPGLGAEDVDGLGSMGVGNDNHTILNNRTSLGVVFRHTNFIHSPFNGRGGTRVLGQVFESVTPGVLVTSLRSIQRSSLIFFAVLLQLHLNAGGTHTILVVIVSPHLGDGHRGDLGSVGVGDGDEASLLVLGLGRGVASRHIGFLHGVGDRHSTSSRPLVHGQLGEAPGPATLGSRRGSPCGFLAAIVQFDGHAGRTDAILVLRVFPRLDAGDGGGIRHMGILDGVGAILVLDDVRSVGLGDILVQDFFHSINEFVTIGVLGQRSAPSPLAFLGRLDALLDLVTQLDVDGHNTGTQAVLIVSVLPSLHAGDSDLFGSMAVCNGEVALRGFFQVARITLRNNSSRIALGNSIFLHGVNDSLAVLLDEEVTPRHSQSLASSVGRNGLAADRRGLAVHGLIEGQRHSSTLAILVVAVVPLLGGGHNSRSRSMRIGNEEATLDGASHLGRVARRHSSLRNGVRNGLASAVLGQFLPLVAPAVAGIQRNRLALGLLASHQLHSHVGGTDAITVVVVIPALGDLHIHSFGDQFVGDGERVTIRRSNDRRLFIAIHPSFFHRIGDLLAAFVHRHVFPCNGSLAQFDGLLVHLGLGDVFRFLIQRHGHIDTLAILVVVVIPHLGGGHVNGFHLMGVGDGDHAIFNHRICLGVASRHFSFIYRPNDGINAVIELGQILEGMAPGILVASLRSGQRSSLVDIAILLQLHINAARTDAVLVAVVLPHLFHGDFRGFGGVGVGQGGLAIGSNVASQLIAFGQSFFVFRPGVDDFLASSLQRQTSQRSFPLALHRQGHRLAGRFPIRQQSDGQARRTNGILVIRVIPHLLHGSFRGVGSMLVGHGQAVSGVSRLIITAGSCYFLNSPYDLLVLYAVILGQTGDLFSPLVTFVGECKLLTITHAIRIQLQLNRIGTDAILIAVVGPDLLHGHFRGGRGMAVLNGEAFCNTTGNRLGVVSRLRKLIHGVVDGLASSLQGQFAPGVAPVVARVQFNNRALGSAIGIQLHLNKRGTNTILVIRVIPRLGYGHAGLTRRVAIGNSRLSAIDSIGRRLGIFLRHNFRPSVLDLLAVSVLGQFGNGVSPFVGLTQSYSLTRILIISQQLNDQTFRTLTIPVLAVVPHLQHGGFRLFRLVRVGDGEIPTVICFSVIAGNCGILILCNLILGHRVSNVLAILILRQVSPLDLPAVASIQHLALDFGAVLQQMNRHAVRTEASSIVGIVPCLGHTDRDGRRRMGVGQGGHGASLAGVGQLVSAHGAFRPGVFNFLAIGILRQFINGGSPAVGLVQRHFRAVGQGNLQLIRTQAILIIGVIPHLQHGSFRGFGSVGVGHGKASLGVAGDVGGVTSHRLLGHGVGNLHTTLELRQIRPGHLQIIASLILGNGLVLIRDKHSRLVLAHLLVQVQGHIGALAVLVVVVGPNLGGSHRNNFRAMLVGDCQGILIQTLAVSSNVSFVHRVFNLHFVRIHRNFLESVSEAISFSHINHSLRNNRSAVLQLQSNLFRTHAITVAVVIPNLGHGHVLGFGRVAVGNRIGNSLAVRACYSIRGVRAIALRQFGSFFQHRIGNSFAIGLLVQARPGVFPAIGSVQRHRIAAIVAIGLQLHSNAGRTLTILVVGVFPLLLHADVDLLNLVRIGQGGGVAVFAGGLAQRIAVHRLFRPGILNQLVVHILGQIFNGSSPVVGFAQRHFRAVGQGDLQARGTLAVLVVLVLPHLLHSHINKDGIQRVGDGEAGGGVTGNLRAISCDLSQLFHRIDNSFAVQFSIQVAPSKLPFVACTKCDSMLFILRRYAVDHKLHLNRLRANALSVVHVVPHLFDGDVHACRIVGVGQRGDVILIVNNNTRQGVLKGFTNLGPLVLNIGSYANGIIVFRFPFSALFLTNPLEVGRMICGTLAQSLYSKLPTIFGRQNIGASVAQSNIQHIRTHTSPVLIIVPNLHHGRFRGLGFGRDIILDMPIRHCKAYIFTIREITRLI